MRALARYTIGLLLVAVLAACSVGGLAAPTSLPPGVPASQISLSNDDNGRTVAVPVGSQIDITLQTIGPGQYGNPQVSSPAVRFVSMSFASTPVPGGPTQLFRFVAVAPGQATISIQGVGNNRVFSITLAPH